MLRLTVKNPGEASTAGLYLLLLVLQKPNKYSTKQETLKQKKKNFKCFLEVKNSFSCYYVSSFIYKRKKK